jgi:hypothetical protein
MKTPKKTAKATVPEYEYPDAGLAGNADLVRCRDRVDSLVGFWCVVNQIRPWATSTGG